MTQNIRVEIKEGSMAHKALLELKQHQKFSESTPAHIVNVALTALLSKLNNTSYGTKHHDTQQYLVQTPR